jgi:hypothetical protein
LSDSQFGEVEATRAVEPSVSVSARGEGWETPRPPPDWEPVRVGRYRQNMTKEVTARFD